MELHTQLKTLAGKVDKLKDQITNEESTKHAFVLPFINILGYDAFNPTEVVPEFTADIGMKKGEKVDYAIYQNGEPILIVECKHWTSALDVHNSAQLFRYFHVTKTRFALLTNGITYKFYTDLEDANKMDEKPFFQFDITDLKDSTIKEIEKFHKSNFDISKIIDNASTLKYTRELKGVIEDEMAAPSADLVKLLACKVYTGRMTANVVEEFTEILKRAYSQLISEKVSNRLSTALSNEEAVQMEEVQEEIEKPSKIETTEEEIEAYNIVLALLRKEVAKERIVYRDTQSYFGILLDNNNRKPICRLHLNGGVKYISTFHNDRKEEKIKIDSIDDIFSFEDQLIATINNYDQNQ
tara:strand:- start:6601 stop:7662 length:1062 start_codon:yes stop_codon:yes gene_type:complete